MIIKEKHGEKKKKNRNDKNATSMEKKILEAARHKIAALRTFQVRTSRLAGEKGRTH